MDKFSAVIVAGGLNSRMGGRNKAFLEIGGKTILSRLIGTLQHYFDEILIVTKKPMDYIDYINLNVQTANNISNSQIKSCTIRTVTDLYGDRSSLTGIHAGIYHAKNHFSFVTPCDAPFIQPQLIRLLIDSIEPNSDLIIPHYDGHYEPLCALYSKHCIAKIEELLNLGDYRIYNLFHKVNVKTISKEELKKADSKMLSFFNVNTPESLQEAVLQSDQLHL